MNKATALVILICLIALYGLFSQRSTTELQAIPSNNAEQEMKLQPVLVQETDPNQQPALHKPNAVLPEQPGDNEQEEACTTVEQLDSDPMQQAAHQWLDEIMGVDTDTLTNLYAYSSEQDLLDAANLGDSTAMLALGINYRWQATHENFQSNRLRPKELPKLVYQTKAFDSDTMNKARYWLMQAALHNQLLGLSEMAFSYHDEVQSTDNPDTQQKLLIKSVAYFVLADSMQPVADQLVSKRFTFKDDIDKQTRLQKEKTNMIAKWQEDRESLGMDPELALKPPDEIKAYFTLLQNLCQSKK